MTIQNSSVGMLSGERWGWVLGAGRTTVGRFGVKRWSFKEVSLVSPEACVDAHQMRRRENMACEDVLLRRVEAVRRDCT